jgi:hypothetical protein
MSKSKAYSANLQLLFDDFLKSKDEREVKCYLVSNSNLPGPRGNLELAYSFVETIEIYFSKNPELLWKLCAGLSGISPDEAPVNDPKEFLPFCGTYGIGAIGSISAEHFDNAMLYLKRLAADSRWRTREAVAMGIQKLLLRHPEKTLNELDRWIVDEFWLVMRAAAAGVAEPLLLKKKEVSLRGLDLHKKIFDRILSAEDRKSYEFKAMKKGLGYTLSVVVSFVPKQGFDYMHRIAQSKDSDILWIIKQNLKKNRLTKNFPKEVALMNDYK